jgi:hypothetical protein
MEVLKKANRTIATPNDTPLFGILGFSCDFFCGCRIYCPPPSA